MRKVLSTSLPQPNNMGDTDSLLPNGKGVWIPIDHGVSDYPVEGLEDLERWMDQMRERPACDRGLNIPPSPGRADAVKALGSAMTTS